MVGKIIGVSMFLVVLWGSASGQTKIDTAKKMNVLVSLLKQFTDLSYDYEMRAVFPNGDKDQLKGFFYINSEQKIYYNECSAFTTLYSFPWFYNADHLRKSVNIVGLDSKKMKKERTAIEANLFQGSNVSVFLDSIVVKKAIIKKWIEDEGQLQVLLVFPQGVDVRQIDITYNKSAVLPIQYDMITNRPWMRSAKGTQVAEATIKCSNFKHATNDSQYVASRFFSIEKEKVTLHKYVPYTLIFKK